MRNNYAVPPAIATSTISNGKALSIFDNLVHIFLLPKELYTLYMDQWKGELDEEVTITVTAEQAEVRPCPKDPPTLYFQFSKTWVSVLPADYLRDISDDKDGSACWLGLMKHTNDAEGKIWMSSPLFKGYYTIFDDEQSKMGFGAHLDSTKEVPKEGEVPTRQFGEPRLVFLPEEPLPPIEIDPMAVLIGGILIGLCCVGIICFILFTGTAKAAKKGERDGDLVVLYLN